jgi:hypothetical protein
MSMTIFLALCILGCDFMLYVLFQFLYGEKRSKRRVQAALAMRDEIVRNPAIAIATSTRTGDGLPAPAQVPPLLAKSKVQPIRSSLPFSVSAYNAEFRAHQRIVASFSRSRA